jgi:hypothetical protein
MLSPKHFSFKHLSFRLCICVCVLCLGVCDCIIRSICLFSVFVILFAFAFLCLLRVGVGVGLFGVGVGLGLLGRIRVGVGLGAGIGGTLSLALSLSWFWSSRRNMKIRLLSVPFKRYPRRPDKIMSCGAVLPSSNVRDFHMRGFLPGRTINFQKSKLTVHHRKIFIFSSDFGGLHKSGRFVPKIYT